MCFFKELATIRKKHNKYFLQKSNFLKNMPKKSDNFWEKKRGYNNKNITKANSINYPIKPMGFFCLFVLSITLNCTISIVTMEFRNQHFCPHLWFCTCCTRVQTPPTHLVLSDIHSSLISSCSLGKILITSPVLVLTTMLLPSASRTSIDSTFLFRRISKPFAVF